MSEFMQGFGDDQRQSKAEKAFSGERLDHGVGKGVPLLQDQNHPDQTQAKHQQPGERVKQPAQRSGQMLQRLLRAQQRYAEKQVMVQPPAPAQPTAFFTFGLEPRQCGWPGSE
ncbi:hypothetical protein D3C87_1237820 [compost metagenome]